MTPRDSRHRSNLPGSSGLRLREPADVLGAIPYLIGYHPTDSVVTLALRGTDLVFAVRHDLPDADAPRDDVSAVVDRLVEGLVEHDATGVVLAGFGPDETVRPILSGLKNGFEQAGLAVKESLRAEHGRYWSYLCRVPTCCPTEGTAYDPDSGPVAVQATLAGQVALVDRQAYVDQLSPVNGPARTAMMAATVRASERLFELLAGAPDEGAADTALEAAGRNAIDEALRHQRTGQRLDDDEVAWLTVLLSSISVRDLAWIRITGPPAELHHHRALWMEVLRRAERDLVAAPGSLFAFAAWRCGDLPLARLAIERVLEENPTYTMALLLDDCLARGVSPAVLDGWPGSAVNARGPRRRSAARRRRRSSSRRAGSRPE